MLTARELEEVRVYSPNREHREGFTRKMRKELARFGVPLRCVDSPDACVEDADLIVTVTTSPKPVFDARLVKKGATVSCVGTFEPDKHEIAPALIAGADRIICDSREAALSESGDLLIPMAQKLISERDVLGSLGDVLNGKLPGRESDDEIILFETVGVAAQDLMVAQLIYEKAVSSAD